MKDLKIETNQIKRIQDLENQHAFEMVGTYLLDFDNQIVYADASLCTMYGLDPGTEGISLNDFVKHMHPDDVEEINRTREHEIRKKAPYHLEYRVFPKPGETRWVLARGKAKDVPNRTIYEGIVIDITRVKEAEFALQAQNKLIKTITDNATSALLMMNEAGYCTFMNPAAQVMFGYTFEEISSKPLHYMIHHHYPDGKPYPMAECPIDRALPQNFEMRAHEDTFFRKDGTSFPVLCAASPIFENGVPVATVIEVRDNSEQKRSAEIVRRHSSRLEILNKIGTTISEGLDLKEILQKVTDATTQITGANFGAFFYNSTNSEGEVFSLLTLSGAPIEAFEKFGMPRNTAVFNHTFSGLGVVRVDDITKDSRYGHNSPHHGMPQGHLPVVSYMAVPVVSKSGTVIGGLFFGHRDPGVFNDEHENIVLGIASQAAIALDNAILYDEVRVLNNKKDEFIGLASHELKTPLTSITGYLQLLQRNEVNGSNKEFLNKAVRQVSKLSTLVSDLLDVSKIQAGKLVLNMESFCLNEMLQEAKEVVQLSTSSHQIILNSSLSVKIEADRQRFEQVLINLLTNAIKYSPMADRVIVQTECLESFVKISVQDFGIGIAPSDLKKIFSRFYRVDGLNPGMSGLGIGLYISAEIVKRHGGEIGVESVPGQGSTFWYTIPLIN